MSSQDSRGPRFIDVHLIQVNLDVGDSGRKMHAEHKGHIELAPPIPESGLL